jgi:Flp pilus assembly pilin Flp
MFNALATLYVYMQSYLRRDEGQDLIEYALIAALISVLLVGGLAALRGGIEGVYTDVQGAFGG